MSGDGLWIPTVVFGAVGLLLGVTALVSIHAWTRAILDAYGPRFSLRTLLIATTPVAVALGMGAWLAS